MLATMGPLLRVPFKITLPGRRQKKLLRFLVILLLLLSLRLLWLQYHVITKVQETAPPPRPPRILLVSALFPLSHSKHSQEDYTRWLAHFLGPTGTTCDVYFYTAPTLAPLVRSLYDSSNHTHELTINTNYTTPFAIPPLAPHEAKYTQMHAWDRERDIHNPELYAVWNAKPFLLQHALLRLHPVNYDYAFWNDAGSFRDPHAFGTWPDPLRVEHVFKAAADAAGRAKEDMVFVPLMKAPGMEEYEWTKEMGPIDIDFSEGSFFGSSPAGISWLARAYYALHDHYISTTPPPPPPSSHHHHPHHPHAPAPSPAPEQPPLPRPPPPFHFVGKDQTLLNTLLLTHPSRFFGVVSPRRAGQLPPLAFSSLSPLSPNSPLSFSTLTSAILRVPPLPLLRTLLAKLEVKIKEEVLGERCVDDWYYYQWWLAGGEGRRGTEGVRGWRRWSFVGLWEGSGEKVGEKVGKEVGEKEGKGEEWKCEETGIVGVEALLVGVFGPRWVERRKAGVGDSLF